MTKRNPGFKRTTNLFALSFILLVACSKTAITETEDNSREAAVLAAARFGVSPQTAWELQQAKAATAKYQDIANALADGYEDIHVDVEGMGHHFMKSLHLDDQFDYRKPEILVYNRDKNGTQRLVAVEYAIPLTEPRPEGFTGDDDEWDGNTGFGLWLLHAWVWEHNPNGVFKAMNPNITLH